MWTMRSWLTTDLGTTREEPIRLTDKDAMHRIRAMAKSFNKYPRATFVIQEDEGDILFSITNDDNGYSLSYMFREE